MREKGGEQGGRGGRYRESACFRPTCTCIRMYTYNMKLSILCVLFPSRLQCWLSLVKAGQPRRRREMKSESMRQQ